MKNNQNKKIKEEFDKKVKELDDIGAMYHDFGYKMKVIDNDGSKTTFTVPDWGNVWKFIDNQITKAKEEVIEEVIQEIVDDDEKYINEDVRQARNRMKRSLVKKLKSKL